MALQHVQLMLEGYEQSERREFSLSHVEMIFAFFLPKGYDVDGNQKVLLNYVRCPSNRPNDYIAAKPMASIGWLEIAGFDPQAFLDLNHDEREIEAARLIRDGLKVLATRKGVAVGPLDEAYEKTLASGFSISWVHKKTSKSRKDRRYMVETSCRMTRSGTTLLLEFCKKSEKSGPSRLLPMNPGSGFGSITGTAFGKAMNWRFWTESAEKYCDLE